jgi:hypothetical protein
VEHQQQQVLNDRARVIQERSLQLIQSMNYFLQKITSPVFLAWLAGSSLLSTLDTYAQKGAYELRIVQSTVECANRKVVVSVEIRATHPDSVFVMGTSNLPFSFPTDKLANPVLLPAENFSGGRYSTLSMAQQSSILTLNVIYQGTLPFTDIANVTTTWVPVAKVAFDILSSSDGCYALAWKDFPGVDINEVVSSGGINEVPARKRTLTPLSACAFEAGRPVATITGDTTLFSGQQAKLLITFTGERPLSLSIGGITYANLTQSPLIFNVFPDSTSTYTISSVSNACGIGSAVGLATVTLKDPVLTTLNLNKNWACAGSVVQVPFLASEGFAPDNVFSVQLSDASGSNFSPIPTVGTSSPLAATLPENLAAGSGYRLRVVASSPGLEAGPGAAFTIGGIPTAHLSGSATIVQGDSATLNIQLTGTPPWQVKLSDNNQYTTSTSPLLLGTRPLTTTHYSLVSVSDACASDKGTTSGNALITVKEEVCPVICLPVAFSIIRR